MSAENGPGRSDPTVRGLKLVDLFDHGRQRAQNSGATEPREAETQTLAAYAEAVARETFEERYDPTKNPADAKRETEHAKRLKDRARAEDVCAYSTARLRDAEDALGSVPAPGAKPAPHPLLLWMTVVVLAFTFAPTFRDRFFAGVDDDVLGWLFAIVSGLCLGGMVTGCILYGNDDEGERSRWGLAGVIGGVLIGVAFGAMRVYSAEDSSEIVYAFALTILELAVVVFLESRARGLRAKLTIWNERSRIEEEFARARNAARMQHDQDQTLLAGINAKVDSHISYIEGRKSRFATIEEAVAAAVKTVLDGYRAGLADNRGYLLRNTKRGAR